MNLYMASGGRRTWRLAGAPDGPCETYRFGAQEGQLRS